jgi:sugar phosphate isomerase/epimerase
MYLSCSTCVYGDLALGDALDRIDGLGFGAFDLFALENMGQIWPSRLAAGDVDSAAVARTIRDSGLRVSSFNCGFSHALNDPDSSARDQVDTEFRGLLELAASVGCSVFTVQTGGHGNTVGRVESFERALEGLQRLVSAAQGTGIRLSFEPHWGAVVEKPADALHMARRLWPDVGITYDPSHFVMQTDIDSLEETEPLLDYAVHVHVRNASPGKMQVSMDEGVVDFAWLVRALRERGYEGALAVEYLEAAESEAVKLRDELISLGIST